MSPYIRLLLYIIVFQSHRIPTSFKMEGSCNLFSKLKNWLTTCHLTHISNTLFLAKEKNIWSFLSFFIIFIFGMFHQTNKILQNTKFQVTRFRKKKTTHIHSAFCRLNQGHPTFQDWVAESLIRDLRGGGWSVFCSHFVCFPSAHDSSKWLVGCFEDELLRRNANVSLCYVSTSLQF